MSDVEDLFRGAIRFDGLDIQRRSFTNSPGYGAWLGAWRVRILANSNERRDYRVQAYGDTFREAASRVLRQLRDAARLTPILAWTSPLLGDAADDVDALERVLDFAGKFFAGMDADFASEKTARNQLAGVTDDRDFLMQTLRDTYGGMSDDVKAIVHERMVERTRKVFGAETPDSDVHQLLIGLGFFPDADISKVPEASTS